MTIERIGHKLASGWGPFLIALMLASPVLYWTFDRRDPVDVLEFRLVPPEIHPGQKVLREITVMRHRSCITEVDLVLIDGARVRWIYDEPTIVSPGPTGVIDEYGQPMTIPKDAAPGRAELRTVTRRICNPLQHIWPLVTQSPPIYFTILPPG